MERQDSETATLVGEEDRLLDRLSPHFTVGLTKYGGRGCFASSAIAAGTPIYHCRAPVSSTIAKPYKKEVCQQCFSYDGGKTLKHRKLKKMGKDTLLMYFCSPTCLTGFEDGDPDNILFDSLMAVEKYYNNDDPEPVVLSEGTDLDQAIDKQWALAEKWQATVLAMKPLKRERMIPKISETDYMEAKYVVGVLYQMYCSREHTDEGYMHEVGDADAMAMEGILFDMLQSSDREKVHRFPYLLAAYIDIFKYVFLVVRPELQPLVTPDAVRLIIGRNLSNAFGIWSETTSSAEDKEFYGFGVFPSASFFNHSCDRNIVKTRKNNQLTFTTTRDVAPHEELCIDYGNYLDEDVLVRRKYLSEWFFDCGCAKCTKELLNRI